MIRRMCDLFSTILIAGVLYSGCMTPAAAQNPTCPTRPVGDSSNACASTAFVQGQGPISVKSFGAKGDGSTDDTAAITAAMNAAIAVKGSLYFPATSACYAVTALSVPDGTSGLRMYGDAKGFPVLGGAGSQICGNSANPVINVTASSGGNTNNIVIEHLKVYNNGAGDVIKFQLVNWSQINDVLAYAVGAGIAINLEGAGNLTLDSVQAYGTTGAAGKFGNAGGATTNVGPVTVLNGQFAVQNNTGTAIIIEGDPLGLTFINTNYETFGNSNNCSIDINGPTAGTPVGSVQFLGIHGESNFNSTGATLADICVGRTKKFGTVVISGGNSWGGGDGTHPAQDFIRVTAARSVIVNGYQVSKLASATGYTRSMIRLEATFPGAGDSYIFNNNSADITGTLYSDANARCTGSGSCTFAGTSILDVASVTTLNATTIGSVAPGTGLFTGIGVGSGGTVGTVPVDVVNANPIVRMAGTSNNDQVNFTWQHQLSGANDQIWQFGMAGSSPPAGLANRDLFFRDGGGTAYLGITNTGIVKVQGGTASTSSTTGQETVTGGLGVSGAIWSGTYLNTNPTTVPSLPTCNGGLRGARMFVTDSNAASFTAGIGAVVATGGTLNVPVVCDATNWRIG